MPSIQMVSIVPLMATKACSVPLISPFVTGDRDEEKCLKAGSRKVFIV